MRHDEAEDMGFGMRKERSEPVIVNMSPPATQRDRWMYEQGRLAERDPRTHSEVAWDLAEKVRRDLDRQSCPGVCMNLAMESIVKHYTTPPAAQRQAQDKPAEWVGLTDEDISDALPSGIYDCLNDPWDCGLGDGDTIHSIKKDVLRISRAIEAKLKEKNT